MRVEFQQGDRVRVPDEQNIWHGLIGTVLAVRDPWVQIAFPHYASVMLPAEDLQKVTADEEPPGVGGPGAGGAGLV